MHSRLRRTTALVAAMACALACVLSGCGSTVATSTGPSPAKCGVTLTAPAASIAPNGANATVAVMTQPECTWNASSGANWITGLSPATGQGAGDLHLVIAANPAATSRQGDVLVNGVRAQIRQETAPCDFELSQTDQHFNASGGTARIRVTTLDGCAWSAKA